MGRTTDLSSTEGIAKITWVMETESTLFINAGSSSILDKDNVYNFFKTEKKDSKKDTKISNFNYDTIAALKADGTQSLAIRHCIPASSIRGSLRNFLVNRLVKESHFKRASIFFSSDADDSGELKKEYNAVLVNALKDPGWHIIQNLFGLATDSIDEELFDESVSSRLKVSVGDLKTYGVHDAKKNFRNGPISDNFEPGSLYGKKILTTRNALDRPTRASKENALHSFIEIAPGNEFEVTLRIINPELYDLGIIAFWESAIEKGLLRFGGLTSVGRGRVKINKKSVRIYTRDANLFPVGFNKTETSSKDILASIYHELNVSESDWTENRSIYLDQIKKHYTKIEMGVDHAG